MTRPALRFRSPELCASVLGIVYEDEDPVPWSTLVELLSSDRHPWKTVENTLYDLVALGALHRIGQAGTKRRADTRALKPTPLGRAWLDRELLPLPGQRDEPDPLEEADRIAHQHDDDLELEPITFERPDE